METREWKTIKEYQDILFDFYNGIAKITINRPRYRNAFTPTTTSEISDALYYCRECQDINVVVLTGAGDKAFCSGGDMHVKGHGGYIGTDGVPRLNVLDVQKQIRSLPKPVIAMVNGYAIGGGHVLHVVCDLTIASENAIFGQTGPKVGSFDAGFGSSYLARIVGQKKAREIWFLCRQYSAQEALEMGLVNTVVPFDRLEDETVAWAEKMMEYDQSRTECRTGRTSRHTRTCRRCHHAVLHDRGSAGRREGIFGKTQATVPGLSEVPINKLQIQSMDIEEFRKYCLSLGDVSEKMPFGKFAARYDSILAFYVYGHMFCFIDIDNFTFVNVKSTSDEIEYIKERHVSVGNPINQSLKHWLQLNFDGDIPDTSIYTWVQRAFEIVRDKYTKPTTHKKKCSKPKL